MQIFPLIGEPSTALGKGERYSHFFDGMFVSMRQAQFMQLDTANKVMKPGSRHLNETMSLIFCIFVNVYTFCFH